MEAESEPTRFFEIKKWNAVAIWSWNIQVHLKIRET
jgi:hypothetical protein